MHMQSSQRERDSMPVIANNHRPEVAFSQRASVSTGICCRAWISVAAGLLLKAALMGCGMGWSVESANLPRNGGSREMLLLLPPAAALRRQLAVTSQNFGTAFLFIRGHPNRRGSPHRTLLHFFNRNKSKNEQNFTDHNTRKVKSRSQ